IGPAGVCYPAIFLWICCGEELANRPATAAAEARRTAAPRALDTGLARRRLRSGERHLADPRIDGLHAAHQFRRVGAMLFDAGLLPPFDREEHQDHLRPELQTGHVAHTAAREHALRRFADALADDRRGGLARDQA